MSFLHTQSPLSPSQTFKSQFLISSGRIVLKSSSFCNAKNFEFKAFTSPEVTHQDLRILDQKIWESKNSKLKILASRNKGPEC